MRNCLQKNFQHMTLGGKEWHDLYVCTVGPQNAPLHNMLLLVAYCVPCLHNMLRWSILCTLHTQYATRGAYSVGSVHMLFQWSSEGTQYALLKNMSRGMFAFLSNCPLDIHLSILRTLCLKPCPHHNCIIVVLIPINNILETLSPKGLFHGMGN